VARESTAGPGIERAPNPWLNAGVPPTTIANRAGHSVDVLLRVCANFIDGEEEIANQRIRSALAA